eukprot:5789392-Pleurochrysis_carterae.AAC.1
MYVSGSEGGSSQLGTPYSPLPTPSPHASDSPSPVLVQDHSPRSLPQHESVAAVRRRTPPPSPSEALSPEELSQLNPRADPSPIPPPAPSQSTSTANTAPPQLPPPFRENEDALLDMGFPADLVSKAIIRSEGDLEAAIDLMVGWQHEPNASASSSSQGQAQTTADDGRQLGSHSQEEIPAQEDDEVCRRVRPEFTSEIRAEIPSEFTPEIIRPEVTPTAPPRAGHAKHTRQEAPGSTCPNASQAFAHLADAAGPPPGAFLNASRQGFAHEVAETVPERTSDSDLPDIEKRRRQNVEENARYRDSLGLGEARPRIFALRSPHIRECSRSVSGTFMESSEASAKHPWLIERSPNILPSSPQIPCQHQHCERSLASPAEGEQESSENFRAGHTRRWVLPACASRGSVHFAAFRLLFSASVLFAVALAHLRMNSDVF